MDDSGSRYIYQRDKTCIWQLNIYILNILHQLGCSNRDGHRLRNQTKYFKTDDERTMNKRWTNDDRTINELWTNDEQTMNERWTHDERAMNERWTNDERTMNERWTNNERMMNERIKNKEERAHLYALVHSNTISNISNQNYTGLCPQRMRLQRKLYRIYTVRFHIFIILCNRKYGSFFA